MHQTNPYPPGSADSDRYESEVRDLARRVYNFGMGLRALGLEVDAAGPKVVSHTGTDGLAHPGMLVIADLTEAVFYDALDDDLRNLGRRRDDPPRE